MTEAPVKTDAAHPSEPVVADDVAITSIGVALPELRLSTEEVKQAWGHSTARGVTQRALPAFDEDEVTLAVAAARDALDAGGIDGADVALVVLATGGAPASAPATVAEALGARRARALHVTGRQAAGAHALVTAFEHVQARGGSALVIAADVPRAAPGTGLEHGEGAAGVACIVTRGAGVALEGAGAAVSDLPGAPVLDAQGYLRGPEVAVDDPGLLARAAEGVIGDAISCDFVIGAGARGVAGVKPAREVVDPTAVVGDAGTAAVPLALAQALVDAREGARGVIAVTDDAGHAVVLRVRVHARPAGVVDVVAHAEAGRAVTYLRAIQERGVLAPFAGVPDEPMGAYVSLPDFAASLPERYRLVGRRCTACGAVQFPVKPVCAECAGSELEPLRLSGRGTVVAVTTIGRGGAPSEFALEQNMTGAYASAIVALEEGPRVAARLTGASDAGVAAGTPVRAVLKRLYAQQGVVRYGFKFRPV